MKSRSPRVLLAEIAEQAAMGVMLDSIPRRVGHYITCLSEKDREIIKQLKSNDIANDVLINQIKYLKLGKCRINEAWQMWGEERKHKSYR